MASTCVIPACLRLPLGTCFKIRVLRSEERNKTMFVCCADRTEPVKMSGKDLTTDGTCKSPIDYVKAEQPLKMSEFYDI